MSAPDRKIVTVFGSSQPRPGSDAYVTAFELGRAIAQAGWKLCNGGYGGTMEAAARGAVSVGGHTLGVTCTQLVGRGRANAYIRQEIPTFDLFDRLKTLARLGRAYVVLPGGSGTLLELAAVTELTGKSLLRSRRVILLGDYWSPVLDRLGNGEDLTDVLRVAPDVADAIAIIRMHFGSGVAKHGSGPAVGRRGSGRGR